MARPGITFEEVKAAAVALLGRGASPSVQRVREVLGTGSNSTISVHLKRWQKEIQQTPKTALPPSVPKTVLNALEQFWKIALEQAEADYCDLKKAAEQSVATAEQARKQALDDTQKLRNELEGLMDALQKQTKMREDLEKQLLVEQERRGFAETQIAAAEQKTQTAVRTAENLRLESEARIRELEDSLSHLRTEAQNFREDAEHRLQYERQRAEASENRLLRIIDQLRSEHASERGALQEELIYHQNRETDLEHRFQMLQEKQAAIQSMHAAAEERSHQLEAELARVRAIQQTWEERHLRSARLAETLRGKLKTALARYKALENELAALHKALADRAPSEVASEAQKNEG